MGSFQDDVLQWVMDSWRLSQGNREFGWGELERVTKVNLPALHRIRDKQGYPRQDTLDRIAEGLGVPAPRRETVLRSAPSPKLGALDWVERARLALDMASSMMRQPTALATAQETAAFDKVADEVRNDEAGGGEEGDQQQPRPA